MERRLFNRHELNEYCAAFSLSLAAPGRITGARASNSPRSVKLHDGIIVPALGQSSARLGEGRHPDAIEEEALRTGVSLGITLIDTSEGYANGRSGELIGRAIADQRNRVFLVSKVDRATDIAGACEASLGRLGTNYLDLYLLHWRMPEADLSAVVAAF
jgi:diketogulonate reductase-like aldo/keto reductase